MLGGVDIMKTAATRRVKAVVTTGPDGRAGGLAVMGMAEIVIEVDAAEEDVDTRVVGYPR